jgi:hypothetical protein
LPALLMASLRLILSMLALAAIVLWLDRRARR